MSAAASAPSAGGEGSFAEGELEFVGVGDQIELDDPAAGGRETDNGEWSPRGDEDDDAGTVHKRRPPERHEA